MARRSRMSIMKRQRELKKAEKAAEKRARRQGRATPEASEPQPDVSISDLFGARDDDDDDESPERSEDTPPRR